MPDWLKDIGPWLSLLAMICQPLFALGLFFLRKSFVSIEKHETTLAEFNETSIAQEKRLTCLENKVGNLALPDVHPMELALKEVQGDLKTLAKTMEMQGEAVRRMEENTDQGMKRIERQVNMLMQHELRGN